MGTDNYEAIKHLQPGFNDAGQYDPSSSLEIHGLAPVPHENIPTVIKQLAVKLGIPVLYASDIIAVHRLTSRQQ